MFNVKTKKSEVVSYLRFATIKQIKRPISDFLIDCKILKNSLYSSELYYKITKYKLQKLKGHR